MVAGLLKKTGLFLSVVLLSLPILKSQDDPTSTRHYPSIMGGFGVIKFTGDVGKHSSVNPLIDARPAFYLKGEYRFGKYFGLMGGGLFGKMAGTENREGNFLNFQSKAMQFDLNFVTYFDHLFKQNDEVSPFLSVGIGYLLFDPYGDLKTGDSKYYYWSDGSVRDLPENPVNQNFTNILKRDHDYETQLTDSLVSYSRSCLSIPIGTGFDFRIGRKWDVQVGVNYNLLFSDYVDNKKSGGNDSYFMGHVGIKYTFVPKTKGRSDDVNFAEVDKLDVDGDGIPDDVDKCLSTPKGVSVDKNGCPPDADHDGVADYMDKEPGSRKGAAVDAFGVTINMDSLAYHQIMWDSLAEERRDQFNEAPSKSTLTKIDSAAAKAKKGDYEKIPAQFKIVDANKDGYISTAEIYVIMDAFFEGSNDFTAEKIEDLINYFFEQ
jgi:hypothetical protein